MTPAPRFLPDGRTDTPGAALYLGLSPRTLAQWRVEGIGPPFVKPCGRVWYRKADLDAWLARTAPSTSTGQARLRLQAAGSSSK